MNTHDYNEIELRLEVLYTELWEAREDLTELEDFVTLADEERTVAVNNVTAKHKEIEQLGREIARLNDLISF